MGGIKKETYFFVHKDKIAAQFLLVLYLSTAVDAWKSPSEFTQPLHPADIQSEASNHGVMEFFPLIIVKENSWFVGSAFQQEQLPHTRLPIAN